MKTNMPGSKEFADFDFDYLETAAAHDCTGLMPTIPVNMAQFGSYEEIYPILPAIAFEEEDEFTAE